MFVIKLLGGLSLLGAIAWAVYTFEAAAATRFDHRFFARRALVLPTLAFVLVMIGHYVWASAKTIPGNERDGIVLMVVGALAGVGLLIWNIRRTGAAFGISGTLLQTTLFSALGYLGVIALVVLVLAWAFILAVSNVEHGNSVVDHHVDRNDWP